MATYFPKKSLRSIKRIAKNNGVEIVPPHAGAGMPIFQIAGRKATIKTAWHGGQSIAQHFLDGTELAIVQAGAKGNWYAVLPAQLLFELLGNQPFRESPSHPESEFCNGRSESE